MPVCRRTGCSTGCRRNPRPCPRVAATRSVAAGPLAGWRQRWCARGEGRIGPGASGSPRPEEQAALMLTCLQIEQNRRGCLLTWCLPGDFPNPVSPGAPRRTRTPDPLLRRCRQGVPPSGHHRSPVSKVVGTPRGWAPAGVPQHAPLFTGVAALLQHGRDASRTTLLAVNSADGRAENSARDPQVPDTVMIKWRPGEDSRARRAFGALRDVSRAKPGRNPRPAAWKDLARVTCVTEPLTACTR